MNKNLKVLTLFIFLSIFYFFISCSIKLPDIKITGEKTALENQILGEYRKIKEDIWLIASERGNGDLVIPVDNSKVLKAMRDKAFYQDDINEYKLKGVLGESFNGYLFIIQNKKYDILNITEKKLLKDLEIVENKARKIILERIMELNPALLEYSKSEIKQSFHKLMLAESPEGTYYQDSNHNLEQK